MQDYILIKMILEELKKYVKKQRNVLCERTKKNTWTLILKVIITVATAVAGALGLNACI